MLQEYISWRLNFIELMKLKELSRRSHQRCFIRGESHINFQTYYVRMVRVTWTTSPPPPLLAICVISRFDKIDSFLKKALNFLDSKKSRLHLWSWSDLNLIVLLASFFFLFVDSSRKQNLLRIPAEYRTKP